MFSVDIRHAPVTAKRILLYRIMKRVSIILFSVYYLLAVSGVTVHYHYCCGKLASVDLYAQRANPCPCGGKPEKRGCCEHKALTAKTDDGSAPDPVVFAQPAQPEFLAAVVPAIALYLLPASTEETSLQSFFPRQRSCSGIPLFLLYLVLRN